MSPPPTPPDRSMLYVIGGASIGGMETHVLKLVERLHGLTPTVVCLNAHPEYVRRLTTANISVVDLETPRLNSVRAWMRAAHRVWRVVQHVKPSLVHTYGFGADLLTPLVRIYRPGCRIVTSRRGMDLSVTRQRLRRFTNHFTDAIFCVSDEVADFTARTENVERRRLTVIPNGVDVNGYAVTTRASGVVLRFGTLGNVKPIKGTDLLVDAFTLLNPLSDTELHIGGGIGVNSTDREWAVALTKRVEASPLADRIRFVGFQDDSRGFLAGLDVFVLPSRSEGMSNALLEAMALGLPCIATDVGSNRSLLSPPDMPAGGLVCQPTVDALSDAMSRMKSDDRLREELGVNGRRIVRERYSTDRMIDTYQDLYSRLLGELRPKQPS